MSDSRKSRKRSSVWLHFEDLGNYKACCNSCSKVLSYKGGTTFNLFRHLVKQHPAISTEFVILGDGNVEEVGNVSSLEQDIASPSTNSGDLISHSRRKSRTWLYFSKVDDDKAKCNFCSKVLSYKGGAVFNLTRHIKVLHPEIEIVDSAEQESQMQDVKVNPKMEIVSATPKRSPAWLVFTEIDERRAKCSYCQQIVCCNRGSTSNLVRHLKAKHDFQYKDENEAATEIELSFAKTPIIHQQNEVKLYGQKTSPHGTPTLPKRSHEIDTSLVEAVTKNYIPFEVVDNVHFKRFIKKLNPTYKLPTRKSVSDYLVPRIYNMVKERAKTSIEPATAVSIAVENWKSVTNENFLSLTAHYIDNDSKMKSCVLECFEYADGCGSDDLAQEFKRITQEWGIEEKIVAAISDDIDLIVYAIEATAWPRVPCFAQNLNSIVQNALEEIREIHCKVKEIVDFFVSSAEAAEKLKLTQARLDMMPLNLKEDSLSTWNSTYDMFHRVSEMKDSLISTIATNYPGVDNLSDEDMQIVSTSCEVLKVFRDVCEEITSEKSVTVSKVILLTQALRNWCVTFVNNNALPKEVKNLSVKLLEGIDMHFSNVEDDPVYAEATLLDPRFKHCGFTSTKGLQNAKDALVSRISEMVPIGKKEIAEEMTSYTINESTIWKDFDFTVKNIIQTPDPTAAAIIELDKYLEEPLLPRLHDPLDWWGSRKNIYPELFEIAKKTLCIIATSVSCNMIFSEAGQDITKQRNCLSGGKVPHIIFLNGNL